MIEIIALIISFIRIVSPFFMLDNRNNFIEKVEAHLLNRSASTLLDHRNN
ncbi:hypothetical protein [Radiobacillus sp. PE A8.2]